MRRPALAPVSAAVGDARPLVSIVMPTYQRARWIGESIDALLRQTCGDFELIVQDDASTDDTAEVVARMRDPRIRYFRNPTNLGMPTNLNVGIERTRGTYVLVCHDHDLCEPSLVKEMITLFEESPRLAYVHSGIRVVDRAGAPAKRVYVGPYARVTQGVAWIRYMVGRFDSAVCANSMVPRRIYEAAGLYDPTFGFVADVEMWMRLGFYGDVGYLAAPLIAVRERESSHPSFDRSWEIAENVVRIVALYHRQVHPGRWRALRLQGRIELYLLRTLLWTVKRGGGNELRKVRGQLRRSPSLVSRLVAALVRD